MRFLALTLFVFGIVALTVGVTKTYMSYTATQCIILLKKPIPNGNLIWLDRTSSAKMEGNFNWLPFKSDSWPLNIEITGCKAIIRGAE